MTKKRRKESVLTKREKLIANIQKQWPKFTDKKDRATAQSLLRQYIQFHSLTYPQWRLVKTLLYMHKQRCRITMTGPRECFVYIMTCGDLLKIGISNKPHQRKADIQCSNGQEVSVAKKVAFSSRQEARKVESAAHQKYKKHRARGEWFDISILANADQWLEKRRPKI